MCSNVVNNQGPYNIAEIVHASFSQGHERTN